MEDDGKLPVTVAKNDTVAAHRPVSAAVELVSEWALLTAFGIAFAPALVVYILYYFHVHCTPSSIVLRCVDLTDAVAAEKAALWDGILCCAVVQSAAAVLALLLPSRRIRHGLAFVALVAAILGHCMYATGVRLILSADPGYLFYRISCTIAIFILAVGDVVMTIVLLLGPGGED
ncbi:unnamed protein product [Miscanthus lutarioriparius]|uniref:Uncharacterized protein n=1 Tax=Miscanthus lutarioriparius TaxID=422564 RepID=A0A811SJ50_9POAL|nr:unnamed protein product [Miscanthus lutarioriparius]